MIAGLLPFRFNPRSPCGERPQQLERVLVVLGVSTHAPLAGSDFKFVHLLEISWFQPTLPLRGATFFSTR